MMEVGRGTQQVAEVLGAPEQVMTAWHVQEPPTTPEKVGLSPFPRWPVPPQTLAKICAAGKWETIRERGR